MQDREKGFTLIELLVVIIIIGILAGIAIPVFFSQRKKAVDKSVVSDVTNASLSLESYYSTNNAYPTTKALATAAANADRIVTSTGDSLTITTDGTTGYCISGSNTASNYAATGKVYDSNKGGLQTDGAPCSTGYTNTITLP
jgi:prepilin-type N-terminal cleavage/methylation domain-containing protein